MNAYVYCVMCVCTKSHIYNTSKFNDCLRWFTIETSGLKYSTCHSPLRDSTSSESSTAYKRHQTQRVIYQGGRSAQSIGRDKDRLRTGRRRCPRVKNHKRSGLLGDEGKPSIKKWREMKYERTLTEPLSGVAAGHQLLSHCRSINIVSLGHPPSAVERRRQTDSRQF